MKWLISSNGERAWRTLEGWTRKLSKARRYSFEEAVKIVQAENESNFRHEFPFAAMCPDWENDFTDSNPVGSTLLISERMGIRDKFETTLLALIKSRRATEALTDRIR
jgi:hypothetical protein